eukprot:scaffold73855_cov63-Phaeocystis_antarctica.AAC.6
MAHEVGSRLVGGAGRGGRLPAGDVDRGEVRRHQRRLHRVERAEGARVTARRLHTRAAGGMLSGWVGRPGGLCRRARSGCWGEALGRRRATRLALLERCVQLARHRLGRIGLLDGPAPGRRWSGSGSAQVQAQVQTWGLAQVQARAWAHYQVCGSRVRARGQGSRSRSGSGAEAHPRRDTTSLAEYGRVVSDQRGSHCQRVSRNFVSSLTERFSMVCRVQGAGQARRKQAHCGVPKAGQRQ